MSKQAEHSSCTDCQGEDHNGELQIHEVKLAAS